ncbi:MAG: transposase [Comamonas sp.]
MSQLTPKKCYRSTNWKQHNSSLNACGSLTIWLDKKISWFAAASGKRRHSPKFSDAAIQFCLTVKSLFGLALRQATGLVHGVAAAEVWRGAPQTGAMQHRQSPLALPAPLSTGRALELRHQPAPFFPHPPAE